jgi:3-hydroxy acid dehydrogenase / malonic semialdehyde reductase
VNTSSKKPLVAITGASMGIGAAAAHRFSKEGYRLALMARRLDKLAALKNALPSETVIYELDVSASDAVTALFKQIEKENGPIDTLINNAGCAFGIEPAYEGNLEEWDKCVQTNIQGLLYCTRAVLPSMVARDAGHIINLGSVAGTYPYPGGNVYGATKAFVHQFSLNLRADLLGTKVRVSCIEPGLVDGTEFSLVRFRGDQKRAAAVYEKAQALHPDDIAEILYFCHRLPSHVNINTVEVMPVTQASGALSISRT